MKSQNETITFLIADDDSEDRDMIRDALRESRIMNELRFVHDGEQMMNYLNRKEQFEDALKYPMPGLILLDLNMPKKDGREVLSEIKSDPRLRQIPIVILSTSKAEEDIFRTYNLGVNSFITKPVTFDGLIQVMGEMGRYWLQIVRLPSIDFFGK
jgi:CheY-like chemotaxis protein